MHALLIAGYILGFVAASAGASLLFKLAADQAAIGRGMALRFVLGNVVGMFAPLFLTLALRGMKSGYIYAIAYGASFCALQVVSFALFRETLSPWQWTGVAAVAAGILLLQIR